MSKPTVTINNERRLYVLTTPHGTSAYGFDNCFKEANALAVRLGRSPLPKEKIGSEEAYLFRDSCIDEVRTKGIDLGTWFDPDTPRELRETLESLRKSGTSVRLWYGDPDTGKTWLEEHDLVGKVGRSTGILKVPLLVAKGDDGGGAILTANVLRIDSAKLTKSFYKHPKFHVPELTVKQGECEGLAFEVHAEGALQARFADEQGAEAYIAFQEGRQPSGGTLSGKGNKAKSVSSVKAKTI